MDILLDLQKEVYSNIQKKINVNEPKMCTFTYWCLNEECIESLECFENKEKLQEHCINSHINII